MTLIPAVLALGAALAAGAAAAGAGASLHGVLYISPSGDLSADVMFGHDVEILLLDGRGELEAELKALKERRLPQVRSQDEAANRAESEFRKAIGLDGEEEKRQAWKREATRAANMKSEYEKAADAVIRSHVIRSTKCDESGEFRFEEVPAGRYFLNTRFEILRTGILYTWLHPVVLGEGERKEVHLNKAASVNLYYGD